MALTASDLNSPIHPIPRPLYNSEMGWCIDYDEVWYGGAFEHGIDDKQTHINTSKHTPTKVDKLISSTGDDTGPSFIKPDQLDPRIKDQLRNALLSIILSLQLPNFVSCGRACPSHMTQNLVTVGAKLWTGEWFSFDPWSLDQADLVW